MDEAQNKESGEGDKGGQQQPESELEREAEPVPDVPVATTSHPPQPTILPTRVACVFCSRRKRRCTWARDRPTVCDECFTRDILCEQPDPSLSRRQRERAEKALALAKARDAKGGSTTSTTSTSTSPSHHHRHDPVARQQLPPEPRTRNAAKMAGRRGAVTVAGGGHGQSRPIDGAQLPPLAVPSATPGPHFPLPHLAPFPPPPPNRQFYPPDPAYYPHHRSHQQGPQASAPQQYAQQHDHHPGSDPYPLLLPSGSYPPYSQQSNHRSPAQPQYGYPPSSYNSYSQQQQQHHQQQYSSWNQQQPPPPPAPYYSGYGPAGPSPYPGGGTYPPPHTLNSGWPQPGWGYPSAFPPPPLGPSGLPSPFYRMPAQQPAGHQHHHVPSFFGDAASGYPPSLPSTSLFGSSRSGESSERDTVGTIQQTYTAMVPTATATTTERTETGSSGESAPIIAPNDSDKWKEEPVEQASVTGNNDAVMPSLEQPESKEPSSVKPPPDVLPAAINAFWNKVYGWLSIVHKPTFDASFLPTESLLNNESLRKGVERLFPTGPPLTLRFAMASVGVLDAEFAEGKVVGDDDRGRWSRYFADQAKGVLLPYLAEQRAALSAESKTIVDNGGVKMSAFEAAATGLILVLQGIRDGRGQEMLQLLVSLKSVILGLCFSDGENGSWKIGPGREGEDGEESAASWVADQLSFRLLVYLFTADVTFAYSSGSNRALVCDWSRIGFWITCEQRVFDDADVERGWKEWKERERGLLVRGPVKLGLWASLAREERRKLVGDMVIDACSGRTSFLWTVSALAAAQRGLRLEQRALVRKIKGESGSDVYRIAGKVTMGVGLDADEKVYVERSGAVADLLSDFRAALPTDLATALDRGDSLPLFARAEAMFGGDKFADSVLIAVISLYAGKLQEWVGEEVAMTACFAVADGDPYFESAMFKDVLRTSSTLVKLLDSHLIHDARLSNVHPGPFRGILDTGAIALAARRASPGAAGFEWEAGVVRRYLEAMARRHWPYGRQFADAFEILVKRSKEVVKPENEVGEGQVANKTEGES